MSSPIATRVSLVTGGSRGIGRAVAERLPADGHAVAVVYLSNQAEAEATVGSITEAGSTAIAVQADVAEEEPSLVRSSRSKTRLAASTSSSTRRASCRSRRSPTWT